MKKDSFFKNIFKEEKIAVNSFHHQSVKKLAPIFDEIAISSDGIIEAYENEQDKILGIQWHPEKMFDTEEMIEILRVFLKL